ncbi:glycerol-3-phosphate dehydrogenase/oxidase [Rhodohalobacter halophilus]|uniref:glycerol-3-phosphate dehydrogenase/oxidase n=1 Tax=Rhodohalobacter halophilus TaxID=1812810 RepID=UPI00083FBCE7|nr:glycerol-3-phosphate dehydrogenase/oxidase [Rhodohalobacter halophilus]
MERERLIQQLEERENHEWDVIIIGGGATGLGVALDATSRGLSTLLLEQSDFAKGTSSRSTKLVHGGVRYLAQGNVDLVREALRERGLLQKNAPHLVQNETFVIPIYSLFNKLFYTAGLKMYDLLSGSLSLGKSKGISKRETIDRLPTIKQGGLSGGVIYHDGQFDDSRLAVNVAQTAWENEATVLNYMEVTNLLKEGDKIRGVAAKDAESGIEYRLKGRAVINATGVFADEILKMDQTDHKKTIRPSQGVHVVLDREFLPGKDAIMIPKTDDGRVLFAVPWHDKVVVGTTDTLLDEHSLEPVALDEEIEFVLSTASRYLTKAPVRNDVKSVFAGLRPLAAPKDGSGKTKEISRSHKIIVSDSGLITITGGKWTTFRKMGEDAIDRAIKVHELKAGKSRSEHLKIHGADSSVNFDDPLYFYGSDKKEIENLIKNRPELGEQIHESYPYVKAQVVWAVQSEMARTVEDFLARRVRVLFLDARAAIDMAPEVAKLIQTERGMDKVWAENQIEEFTGLANRYLLQEYRPEPTV